MKAMLLAAGEGRRMRPLTINRPKPLIDVGGSSLISYHLQSLKKAGVEEVIINISYLGHMIEDALGDGRAFGLHITYSREPQPLETAGGILKAAPLLGDDPFLLVNGDVWTDYPLHGLMQQELEEDCDAKLILVANPDHHPEGDYAVDGEGFLELKSGQRAAFTYSGISVMRASAVLNSANARDKFPLREVFLELIQAKRVRAELYSGYWQDVGTPERLQQLEHYLLSRRSD